MFLVSHLRPLSESPAFLLVEPLKKGGIEVVVELPMMQGFVVA